MNRSFASTFKSASGKKQKQTGTLKSGIGFQTMYKSRNDHTILKHVNAIIKSKTNHTETTERSEKDKFELKRNVDREIKNYAKSLRKPSMDADQEKFRESESKESQNVPIESFQLGKSFSQPQLILKKTSSEEQQPLPTLDILQKKVQELLELKLLRKSQNKSILSLRMYEDELEKDLQALIVQIQQFSQLGQSKLNESIDLQIKEITQKIGILERVIAESFTESQMLKKYYFMKKLSRKPFTIFDNHIRRASALIEVALAKNHSMVPQHPSLHFSTINQSSYLKPQREAYQKLSKNAKSPPINRQSLGRSSYQTEFLNYGSLPTYPTKKDSEASLSTVKMAENKSSLYQTDFKQKKVSLIDSKLLDCRRDKFKPTPITFMPRKMIDNKENKDSFEVKVKKGKGSQHNIIFEATKNPNGSSMSYSSIYKESTLMRNSDWLGSMGSNTEYKSNFSGDKAIIECLSKQSNLNSLKYEFRKNFNA